MVVGKGVYCLARSQCDVVPPVMVVRPVAVFQEKGHVLLDKFFQTFPVTSRDTLENLTFSVSY